jgi:hypothetical protein
VAIALTTFYNLTKLTSGSDTQVFGNFFNSNWDIIDAALNSIGGGFGNIDGGDAISVYTYPAADGGGA